MRYLINMLIMILLVVSCHAQGRGKDKSAATNALPAKVEKEKEKKLEHTANKIIRKERDKGSKKETDWKPSKEFPLMFGNNRLGRKPKDNKK